MSRAATIAARVLPRVCVRGCVDRVSEMLPRSPNSTFAASPARVCFPMARPFPIAPSCAKIREVSARKVPARERVTTLFVWKGSLTLSFPGSRDPVSDSEGKFGFCEARTGGGDGEFSVWRSVTICAPLGAEKIGAAFPGLVGHLRTHRFYHEKWPHRRVYGPQLFSANDFGL